MRTGNVVVQHGYQKKKKTCSSSVSSLYVGMNA